MALGRIPNPITKQSVVNMATARHFVDTLTMLEKKTVGNLTEDERRMLEEIQHQLRLMIVTGGTAS
jgi:tRNA A37 N6-isopentenylltransferase MiaA